MKAFGGIDILVNNASAIALTGTLRDADEALRPHVSASTLRGTFVCSQACLPHLRKAANPHILTLSPPLNMHVTLVQGPRRLYHGEIRHEHVHARHGRGISRRWRRGKLAVAAHHDRDRRDRGEFPQAILDASRKPAIVADAAYVIFNRDSRKATGNFYIDEAVLSEEGVTDFTQYAVTPGAKLYTDLFLD